MPDGAAQVRVWHAEQLVELPRKAVSVVPGAFSDTMQLGVVPRVRRAPPAAPAPAAAPGSYGHAPAAAVAHSGHAHAGR